MRHKERIERRGVMWRGWRGEKRRGEKRKLKVRVRVRVRVKIDLTIMNSIVIS